MPRAVGACITVVAMMLRWSIIAVTAVMLACITIQVVMRYVFSSTPSWTEELAILMFAWVTLGGLALGVYEGFHVRLTLLLDRLSPPSRATAERVLDAIAAVLGGYLLWSGWRYVDITAGSTSAAIAYPIEMLHGMSVASGFLMLLFAAQRVVTGPAAAADLDEAGSLK